MRRPTHRRRRRNGFAGSDPWLACTGEQVGMVLGWLVICFDEWWRWRKLSVGVSICSSAVDLELEDLGHTSANQLLLNLGMTMSLLSVPWNALVQNDVKKWWIWGYWISPLMYVQNAISVNEFLGHSWQKVLPGSSEPLGVLILKSRGVFPEARWYWIGFGALLGFTLLFNFLFILCLAYLKPYGQPIHQYQKRHLRRSMEILLARL